MHGHIRSCRRLTGPEEWYEVTLRIDPSRETEHKALTSYMKSLEHHPSA